MAYKYTAPPTEIELQTIPPIAQNPIGYYQSLYEVTTRVFYDFFQRQKANPTGEIDRFSCDYFLNNMEIELLMLIQARVYYAPASLLQEEVYLPVITDTIFIRQCRVLLHLPRDVDFATQFSDRIYPVLEPVISRSEPAVHALLFGLPASAQQIDLGVYNHQIRLALDSLIRKFSSITGMAHLLLVAASQISQLKQIIHEYAGDQAAFLRTSAGIKTAIEFRIKKKKAFESGKDGELKVAFNNLKAKADEILKILDSNPEQQVENIESLLQSGIVAAEQQLILEEQKYYLLGLTSRFAALTWKPEELPDEDV